MLRAVNAHVHWPVLAHRPRHGGWGDDREGRLGRQAAGYAALQHVLEPAARGRAAHRGARASLGCVRQEHRDRPALMHRVGRGDAVEARHGTPSSSRRAHSRARPLLHGVQPTAQQRVGGRALARQAPGAHPRRARGHQLDGRAGRAASQPAAAAARWADSGRVEGADDGVARSRSAHGTRAGRRRANSAGRRGEARAGGIPRTRLGGGRRGGSASPRAWPAGSRAAAVDVPWAPTLGLRLDLALDGLGALYALLATGIGVAVFAYGAAYLPWHLEHEGRPASEARRFWAWMVLFMASMVGLACARDLVLLFVFFDLTAVASYFLIGFDRERREARGAALMALLVTGVSAVAMLIGAVLLFGEYGTFSLPELFERAGGGTTTAVAGGADRRRRAGQERAGAAALLAAARDGGADAGVGVPALGRDGGGRRARARPRAPAARAQRRRARRPARGRPGVDRRSAACWRSRRTSSSRSSPTRRSPSTGTWSCCTGSAAPRAPGRRRST